MFVLLWPTSDAVYILISDCMKHQKHQSWGRGGEPPITNTWAITPNKKYLAESIYSPKNWPEADDAKEVPKYTALLVKFQKFSRGIASGLPYGALLLGALWLLASLGPLANPLFSPKINLIWIGATVKHRNVIVSVVINAVLLTLVHDFLTFSVRWFSIRSHGCEICILCIKYGLIKFSADSIQIHVVMFGIQCFINICF